jgi:hypothetical protein
MTWRTAHDLQQRQRQLFFALDEALAGLTEREVDTTRLADGRSVRVVLAHLVLTETAVLDDLRLMLAVEHPDLPSLAWLDDADRLRAVIARAPTVPALVAALEAACAATGAFVAALDEEQEARTGHGPELGNVAVGAHAALNVSYHALGHVAEMRASRQSPVVSRQ